MRTNKVEFNEQILEAERLELVPLLPYQLKLWAEDIPSLEKNLKCSYQAEPMEGPFLELAPLISRMFRIQIKRSKSAMGWEKSLSSMDT